jgi:hypothetical protein
VRGPRSAFPFRLSSLTLTEWSRTHVSADGDFLPRQNGESRRGAAGGCPHCPVRPGPLGHTAQRIIQRGLWRQGYAKHTPSRCSNGCKRFRRDRDPTCNDGPTPYPHCPLHVRHDPTRPGHSQWVRLRASPYATVYCTADEVLPRGCADEHVEQRRVHFGHDSRHEVSGAQHGGVAQVAVGAQVAVDLLGTRPRHGGRPVVPSARRARWRAQRVEHRLIAQVVA